MSWMLNVSGQIPHGLDAREVEHRLAAELNAVLSRPEFGAVTSWLRGIHVASSSVHRAPEATPQDETAVAPVAEPAPPAPVAEAVKAAPSRGGKATAARASGA